MIHSLGSVAVGGSDLSCCTKSGQCDLFAPLVSRSVASSEGSSGDLADDV